MTSELGGVAEQAAVIMIFPGLDNDTGKSSAVSDLLSNRSYSNTTMINPYDVPKGLIVLLAFLYGSISLLAVIGNGLVILVIVKNRRMHTVTNIFIANLAVSDVIIGLFSIPFQVVSVNVSIFTLSVIAVDRYIAVIHPFKAGCSKKSAAIIISVIWAVGVGAGIPVPMFYWVVDDIVDVNITAPRCSRHAPNNWTDFHVYYNTLLVCFQYLLPLVIITFCYCRIAWHIWGSRRPGAHVTNEDVRGRNKRKVVKMMIIVVCLFVLCWLPLQIYNLLDNICPLINDYLYINIIWFSSHWLAMSNSCYNPFIYGLLNEKFKREFRQLFAQFPCWKASSDHYTEYFSEDANIFRRANGNCSANRHGAVRYNFYREDKKVYVKQCQVPADETETSNI